MSAKKIVFLIILVLVLTLGVVGVSHTSAAPAAAFPTSRDPIYWPGPANGIWNMPIHNNAVYVPAGIGNHMPSAAGPTTDPEILILSPNSPLKNLVENDAGWDGGKRCTSLTGATLLTGVPIPANFTTGPEYAGSTPNNSGAILMADGVTVYETQPLHVCSAGGTVTSQYMWAPYNIKTGAGILGSHGGSGMTALGGSVRYGELMPGSVIRHAMKMNFYALYNYSWTGGGYRWPAPYADSYASAALWGGSVPAMREGSLLALKPDFNINSLQTGPAKIIAQAAMDYGIYAVDDTYWDVFALDVEEGPLGSVGTQFQSQYGYGLDDGPLMNCTATTDACKYSKDMWTILSSLNVIDNNTATTIGGGLNSDTVNRRAPMAPPFIGQATATAVATSAGPTATKTNTPAAGPTATKTKTPIPGAGSLSGAAANNSTAVNLTTQGTTDWAHFYTTVNRKSDGGSLITQSVIGGTATGYTDDARRISWTGGAPTASSTNNRNGLYISGVNNGFQLVVPADTTPRTLKVYVGGWNSTGKINAHLSDGSAVDYNFTGAAFGASYDYVFTFTYTAASAGQTLTVKWTQNAGTGNVALNGAALSGGGAGPTNTPVPPTITKTNTPVGPTATRTNTPVGPTATPSGTWTLKDDNVAGWTWSGWTQYSDAALQGGTAHGSGTAGHYGQYTFTGTSVEVYAWKGLGGGTLQVYIDGVSQGTFSQSNGTEVFKQLIYSNTTLTSGSHTVKIVGGIPAGADWAMVDYIRYK